MLKSLILNKEGREMPKNEQIIQASCRPEQNWTGLVLALTYFIETGFHSQLKASASFIDSSTTRATKLPSSESER